MAQINTQMPNNSDYFGGKAVGMMLGLDERDQAMRSIDINQQQALQDLFQSGEKHPLDMQTLKDISNTRQAQLPGVVADSSQKEMDTRDNNALGDIFRQDVKKSEGKSKIVAGKEREFAYEAMTKANNEDPNIKAEGMRMLHALNAHEDMKQEAMQKRNLALEDRRYNHQMERDNKFGRFAPRADPSAVAKIKAEYSPEYWMNMAMNEPDEIKREFFTYKARTLQAMGVEKRNAMIAAKIASQPDLAKLAGLPKGEISTPAVPDKVPAPPADTTPPKATPGTASSPQAEAPLHNPATETGPARGAAARTKPPTSAEFDALWKTLKSGQSTLGPDGKTYTKK